MNDLLKRLQQLEQDDPTCQSALFRIDDVRSLIAVVMMLTEPNTRSDFVPVLIFEDDCGTLKLNGKEIGSVKDSVPFEINLMSVLENLTIPCQVKSSNPNGGHMDYLYYGRKVVDGLHRIP